MANRDSVPAGQISVLTSKAYLCVAAARSWCLATTVNGFLLETEIAGAAMSVSG